MFMICYALGVASIIVSVVSYVRSLVMISQCLFQLCYKLIPSDSMVL